MTTSSRVTTVSNRSSRPAAPRWCWACGLRDDVVNPKPHPEPYLTAARRLGIDPLHCLALEDSHSGVRAAHAAGMQTVMVPDLVHPDDAIRALGISVVESLNHVRLAAFRR